MADEGRKLSEKAQRQLPRVAITYCTQCNWMLRAAYFAQELLSTFSTSLGEIALLPRTGGIFTVHLTYTPLSQDSGTKGEDEHEKDGGDASVKEVLIWDRDRKADGRFPEAKELKQRIRDHIDPSRSLGHSDRKGHASSMSDSSTVVERPAATQVSQT